jgi:hypothetical protein
MKIRELCVATIVGALSGAVAAVCTSKIMQRPELVTSGFQVLDEAGRIRGQFKLFKDDTVLFTMNDAQGQPSIGLHVEPGGSAHMSVMQAGGSVDLGVGTEVPYLILKDTNREVELTSSHLLLKDTNGTGQVMLRSLIKKE